MIIFNAKSRDPTLKLVTRFPVKTSTKTMVVKVAIIRKVMDLIRLLP